MKRGAYILKHLESGNCKIAEYSNCLRSVCWGCCTDRGHRSTGTRFPTHVLFMLTKEKPKTNQSNVFIYNPISSIYFSVVFCRCAIVVVPLFMPVYALCNYVKKGEILIKCYILYDVHLLHKLSRKSEKATTQTYTVMDVGSKTA